MEFTVNMLLTCSIYSGIPNSRTSRGNANWFEKSDSSRNRGQNYSARLRRWNDVWFELSGGSKK